MLGAKINVLACLAMCVTTALGKCFKFYLKKNVLL